MSAARSEGSLRIVLVEDSIPDSELIARTLRELQRPTQVRRVETEAELRHELSGFSPHIVLSDHSMPQFSGKEALRVVRTCAPDVPFIFVSGTIGEEAAIEALQRGATDYVLKDNLRRLPTAIVNALAIAAKREELRRTELALLESEERFRAIVESTEDWVWETDLHSNITYSNRSVSDLLGYPLDAVIGRGVWEFMSAEEQAGFHSRHAGHVETRSGWRQWQGRWRHADGSIRWLESTAKPRMDEHGAIAGFRGIDRDVTQRIEYEAKIRQLARFHAVLSALGNAILRAHDIPALLGLACRLAVEQGQFMAALIGTPNADGHLEIAASAGDRAVIDMITGLGAGDPASPEHRMRPSLRVFLSGEREINSDYDDPRVPPVVREQMRLIGVGAQVVLPIGTPPWAVLGLCSRQAQEFDGEEIVVLERLAAEIDYARDFIAKSERLEYLAYRDPVSGLPNRSAFQAQLEPMLRGAHGMVGVIHIVQFRQTHDSRGRTFEEQMLSAIGARLHELFGDGGLLAHTGGESFIFWRNACGALDTCLLEAERLMAACDREPVLIAGEQVHFSLRCGLVLAPEQGVDFETIERNANSALAEAERRDVVLLGYSDELQQRAERRILLERELRVALASQQFALFLQPKFDGATRELRGAEALLRWRHPEHGLISPGEFIPLLEATGLIIPAGQWVMATALAMLQRWRDNGLGRQRVAINVSARELREHRFLERCRDMMRGHDADHGLDIEVTESVLIDDIERNIEVFDALRALRCGIAIDDFGTGYSSLSYLSRLPADVLKIDQSFTTQLAENPDTLALVTNIISLAHSLRLQVVAEGVETEEQEKLLRLLRCDVLQGYRLGRPMPVDEFERRFLS